jgi:hypothetical protein
MVAAGALLPARRAERFSTASQDAFPTRNNGGSLKSTQADFAAAGDVAADSAAGVHSPE